MGDWSIATNNGGTADFAAYGPPVYETSNPWTADDGTPLGRGAVYMSLKGKYDGTGSTSWLGLDKFNGSPLAGIALSRITTLKYYAYVGHIPTATSPSGVGANWESWKGWYKYPRHPISLQITAQSPDGTSRKQFWFAPWVGGGDNQIRGDNCGQNCKKWLDYDCIDFSPPGPSTAGSWYSPADPEEVFSSWADLIAAYGNWKLVATSNSAYPTGWKSAGWSSSTNPKGSPTCTATGKCINFEWGARQTSAHVFTENIGWENDYQLGKGCVDLFTLGIDGVNVAYDFEPAASAKAPALVATNNQAVYDAITNNPSFQNTRLTKVVGKCVWRNVAQFRLDDGSGKIVEGILINGKGDSASDGANPISATGQWWSVWGYFEKPPFEISGGPWCIWTTAAHMRKFK
jgi:hypothetical protein